MSIVVSERNQYKERFLDLQQLVENIMASCEDEKSQLELSTKLAPLLAGFRRLSRPAPLGGSTGGGAQPSSSAAGSVGGGPIQYLHNL